MAAEFSGKPLFYSNGFSGGQTLENCSTAGLECNCDFSPADVRESAAISHYRIVLL